MAELLLAPYDGLPAVIDTEEKFEKALEELKSGNGPFSFDAERASGFRYSARAYLVQIKRNGGGLHLIDPIPFGLDSPLFARLNDLIKDELVILHASTQDLPCLREIGISPTRLFDTELAGRIAGLPRVGLGALTESLLDITLTKEHSAVDWSQRPLPADWLTYAALDVELLVELMDSITAILIDQGKLKWALEEFEAILKTAPAPKKVDVWRKTSGIHKLKRRSQIALVRELFITRDSLAQELDTAPGRLLSDNAINAIATAFETVPIKSRRDLEKVFRPLGIRSRWLEHWKLWIDCVQRVTEMPDADFPEVKIKSDALPHIKVWREKFPERFIPLSHARHNLALIADDLQIPVENLLTPEYLRRICWMRPDVSEVEKYLEQWGARSWQIDIATPILQAALLEPSPLVIESEESAPEEE